MLRFERWSSARTRTTLTCLLALGLGLGACDDGPGDGFGRAEGPGLGSGAAAAPAGPAVGAPTPEAALRPLRDADFVESDSNRDPFRNYAVELKGKTAVVAQRTVLMPSTPLKNMRLIAIISGIDQPRAMIVDERGVGHVTSRGDFVGQADVVQTGGAENLPVALNWRVDRIRENEVVLAREDPTGPNRPPLIQVIPLHPAEEIDQQSIAGARGDEG
jgi:type IV pilus assembly protein PilP